MRVLHAPVNIGNQPWVLSRNERKFGVSSELVVHHLPPAFTYRADRALSSRISGRSDEELRARVTAGLMSPLEYDVLHYYFGMTLFTWDDYDESPFVGLDLSLAKALGRRIIFTLQGCDVRLARESNARYGFTPCREGYCHLYQTCLDRLDAKRRDVIRDLLPMADKIFYLNPELGYYLPQAEFLPYSSVEISELSITPPATTGTIRVVHAPTADAIKGTPSILAALESLKGRYDFEVILVRNMAHHEAMEVYRSADLVIDQVLAGWYGGFAVEAMAMGKPVLCYLREEDFPNVPKAMIADLPIHNTRPYQLAEDIAEAFDRRAEWPEWSSKARRYVDKWHNPSSIADAMIRVYKDPSQPAGWMAEDWK
jgi:hypothetical protein